MVGRDNLCTTLGYRGLVGAHGGFVEQVVIPVGDFFEVTGNVMPNLVEPLLVAVHAIEQLKSHRDIAEEKSVLVQGAGCIGICLAGILRDVYGINVQIFDPLSDRLKRAAEAGFNTINGEQLASMHHSFSVVIDAAGKDLSMEQQPLDQAIDLCAAGGCIVGIGTYFISLDILPARILFQEISLLSSFAYTRADVEELARIQSSLKIDFQPMLTQVPFENIVEEGFYHAELDRNAFTRITTSPYQANVRKIAA
jgi:(R,R)-butanediol dehydrogenase/meso-butanediol dehydrogenase/diacetyl reductase